jgi:hypothetical protein
MTFGFQESSAFRGENRNNPHNHDSDDIEGNEHDRLEKNNTPLSPTNTHTTKEIIAYAIPLTRRNVTRIPNAKPIRWNQQDPPAAEPEKPIQLPKVATPLCIVGSLILTLLTWSLMAAVTFAYGYVVWNSILFLFKEGVFYEMVENNKTTIVVNR